jgi:hypothetical protein
VRYHMTSKALLRLTFSSGSEVGSGVKLLRSQVLDLTHCLRTVRGDLTHK